MKSTKSAKKPLDESNQHLRVEMLRLLERRMAVALVCSTVARLAQGAAVREHLGDFLVLLEREDTSIGDLIESLQHDLEAAGATPPKSYVRKAAIPSALRWEVWNRDGFKCHYCGSSYDLVLDHVVPEAKGGATTAENLVTACKSCNGKKGRSDYRAFLERIAMEDDER